MKKVMVNVLSIILVSGVLFAAEKPKQRSEGVAGGWPEITNSEGDATKKVEQKVMMASWGDVVFMYGPQTDAGLATPEQIENMIKYWKSNGFTDLFWRGEDLRDPNFIWNKSTTYAEASFIRRVTENVKASFDTTAHVIKTAHKYGMKVYMWQSVYDDGTPPDKLHRKWSQGFPWRNSYFDEHPELDTRDRKGNIQWGVRELAYPIARQSKVKDYVIAVSRYPDLDGVYVYMHSHSDAPDRGDQYGFNQIIVDEYKKRYGVDILTDPRFDCFSPDFNINDEAVENWRKLRGEYLTQLLIDIKTAIVKIKPDIKIAVNTQGGDYFGPPFGNMYIDWRKWIKDDLIDMLVVRTWMAGGCGAYDFSSEGYLTWGDTSFGAIPYTDIRKVISESGNDVSLITRSRAYLEGANGYYDSSNRDEGYPKRQRQLQLEQNMAKDGKINFIDQNFESDLPLEKKGYLDCTYGGKRYFIGDMRYWANENISPGFSGPLTGDIKQSPAIVDLTAAKGQGTGVYIDEKGLPLMIARRTGIGWPDEPLNKGKVTVSFDLYCQPSSLVISTIMLNGKPVEGNIGVKIDETGMLLINSAGKWLATGQTLEAGVWASIKLNIDFQAGSYNAVYGSGSTDVFATIEDGKGSFNGLSFKCYSGQAYIDNVKVEWVW